MKNVYEKVKAFSTAVVAATGLNAPWWVVPVAVVVALVVVL